MNMVGTLHSVYKTEHILALEGYENGIRDFVRSMKKHLSYSTVLYNK